MSDFIQNLLKERDDLMSVMTSTDAIKSQLADIQSQAKALWLIHPHDVTEEEQKTRARLERETVRLNHEIESGLGEYLDRRNRINEIDRLLQSQDNLDAASARLEELQSELADLDRTAAQFDDGILKLEAIKADAQLRLDGLTATGSAALLASVGLGSADAPPPKQSAIQAVQHELAAVNGALETARATRQEHDDHIHAVRRDIQNQRTLIGQAKCDVAATEHAQALGQYLAVLARLRSAERAIGQWVMPIDHERLVVGILREAEGY